MSDRYQPSWNSLQAHPTPQWLKDVKFGIYTHWGVYSVPAFGPNGTWYPYRMYRDGTEQQAHHTKTYGPPSEFGYKDFIPMFTAEKFDPDEWAALFKRAGAKFAGAVAEHHDGFTMWDSAHTEWNAARMGPKRDVVGELERAIRGQDMRFLVALHHFENWWFYPHWRKDYDTSDPQFAGLYGPPHDLDGPAGEEFFEQTPPDRDFLELWKAKTYEVLDKYRPDIVWFDFGLSRVQEHYKAEMLAHYYNQAERWRKEVAVTYKLHDLPPAAGIIDYELGRMERLTYHEWITDTSVDDQGAWSYVEGAGYKPVTRLVHNLIDNVSKNGYLLLNVGPKADGTIPEEARGRLLGIGEWLDVNGEAVYGTTPWMTYGEGPTKMEQGGMFSEREDVSYTAEDIRFTVKGDVLYAICLGWPGERVTIRSGKRLYEGEIRSIRLLGAGGGLDWSMGNDGLIVTLPDERPCEHAFVLRIERSRPW